MPTTPNVPGRNAMSTTLTADGKPLPNVTTWDRFYQASLRSRVFHHPLEELEALWNAQDFAEEEGFMLYEVLGSSKGDTASSWYGGGKGARRTQAFWYEYATRMGMEPSF